MENYEIKEFDDKELKERTRNIIQRTISLLDEWNVLINDTLYSKESNDELSMVDKVQLNIVINQLTTYRKNLLNTIIGMMSGTKHPPLFFCYGRIKNISYNEGGDYYVT